MASVGIKVGSTQELVTMLYVPAACYERAGNQTPRTSRDLTNIECNTHHMHTVRVKVPIAGDAQLDILPMWSTILLYLTIDSL